MVDLAWDQLGPEGVLRMLLAEHVDAYAHLVDGDDDRELAFGLWRAFRRRGYHVTDGVTIEGLE